jgi:Rieske Fe-S protein
VLHPAQSAPAAQPANPPAADASGNPGGSTGGAAAAAPLDATSAVPVGGGTILADRQIVLAQPTAGTFKAFTAVCTHQGCTVSSVDNGLIICPCHGSRFHLADGTVDTGPASRPLAEIGIKVAEGQITLA